MCNAAECLLVHEAVAEAFLPKAKALKAFKITQQSGAYWKNDKENKMLTRINGCLLYTSRCV